MAYISGTALNDTELFQILIDFLTTNQDLLDSREAWELMGRQSVTSGNAVSDFVSLRGPGLAQADNIYINLEHYQYPLTDTFSFRIVGSVNYLASALIIPGTQPDNSMTNVSWSGNVILRTPLQRNPMLYWIVANGRRFAMAINHGSRWGAMYGGFILPFGFPSQYPYPLLVGACNSTIDSYQNPPVSNYIFSTAAATAASQAGALYKPGGGWCGGPLGLGVGTGKYSCWPLARGDNTWQISANTPKLNNMIPLLDKNNNLIYGLLPINLISQTDTDKRVYGTLDGIYFFNAFNAAAGDLLIRGADTYLVFQIESSTQNAHNFALKLT